MQTVNELQRHASPGGRPQPIAVVGDVLWVGCWDTSKVYAIDPKTWTVREEHDAPGKPYGIAPFGGVLHIVVSIGDDDDRYFYNLLPGKGIDAASKTECPDLTGSHLATDGTMLYLAQMTNGRILALDADGNIQRTIKLPSRCAGFGFKGGTFYMITADDEFEDLNLATLDITQSEPQSVQIAPLPPESRSLAFDGTAWWTNQRENNEIVSFTTA